jgi:hypothetical protein
MQVHSPAGCSCIDQGGQPTAVAARASRTAHVKPLQLPHFCPVREEEAEIDSAA